MPVTIKVNGVANSLVHRGSNGISIATVPDVCKTPSPGGPVPIPYPNISMSADLMNGTTTVTADGGNMIAVKGSEFMKSTGDEPGVAGGVMSGTFIKESTWILYSFDTKMDGKNACRLSDKMFHNHQNTINAQGELQPPAAVMAEIMDLLCKEFCEVWKEVKDKGGQATKKLMDRLKNNPKLAQLGLMFEQGFLIKVGGKGAAAALGRAAVRETAFNKLKSTMAKKAATLPLKAVPVVGWLSAAYDAYEVVRIIPDVVRVLSSPAGPVIDQAFDFKFPNDRWRPGQEQLYQDLAGGKKPQEISLETCDGCKPKP